MIAVVRAMLRLEQRRLERRAAAQMRPVLLARPLLTVVGSSRPAMPAPLRPGSRLFDAEIGRRLEAVGVALAALAGLERAKRPA
jgi:hypothetical protein